MKNKRRKSQPAGFWQEHVRKWHQSGQKQAVYCREAGIRQSQFGYWLRKQATESTTRPEQFVEVSPRVNIPGSTFAFEVELAGGIRIRLEKADPETLKMVIRVIQEATC